LFLSNYWSFFSIQKVNESCPQSKIFVSCKTAKIQILFYIFYIFAKFIYKLHQLSNEKIILGIDPGTTVMGYGVIDVTTGKVVVITLGMIELHKLVGHFVKLQRIFERTLHLIDNYGITEMAIEAPFYSNNVQSMLKLGRAQGAAIAAALYRNLPVTEYLPRKIKMAITGNGNAAKEQVAAMLQSMFNIKELPKKLDATDGLAAAVCHFYQNSQIQTSKSANNWEDFIRQNPDKVAKK